MASKLKIQRLCPESDPHTRIYFSRAELTKLAVTSPRGMRGIRDPVLKAVLEIPGVAMSHVSPYSILVVKAPTYEWDEIEVDIMRLLTAFNLGEGALENLT